MFSSPGLDVAGTDHGLVEAAELYPFGDSGATSHDQCIDRLYHLVGIVSLGRLGRSAHVTSRLGIHSHGALNTGPQSISLDGNVLMLLLLLRLPPPDTDSILPPLATGDQYQKGDLRIY